MSVVEVVVDVVDVVDVGVVVVVSEQVRLARDRARLALSSENNLDLG